MSILESYKRKTFEAVLFSHGFIVKEGGDHSKFYCNKHKVMLTIPRHRNISAGVIKQSTDKLVKYCGFNEDDLRRALK